MDELIQHLEAKHTVTLFGFTVSLVAPEDPIHHGGKPIPTYWKGNDGFPVTKEFLQQVRIDAAAPVPEEKEDDSAKFFECLYIVRVLSDRPQGDVSGPGDLAEVLRECHKGDFVGELVNATSREVSPMHMAEMLNAAGSEPGFFSLQDAQELASDLHESASTEGCSPDLVVVERGAYNQLMRTVGLEDYTLAVEEVVDAEEEDA